MEDNKLKSQENKADKTENNCALSTDNENFNFKETTAQTDAKKHIEFTKILTASIVIMYVINWAVTWLVYANTGNVSAELKEYLDVPLNVVMAGYLTKSGVENVLIKKN